MSSKHEYRLLFLKQFTSELIINSSSERKNNHMQENLQNEGFNFQKEIWRKSIENKNLMKNLPIPEEQQEIKPIQFKQYRMEPIKIFNPISNKSSVQIPNSNKVLSLINNPQVNLIECPGPGKFMLVKVLGRPQITKITLTKEEIQETINYFSEQAKIPVISGLFKAKINNIIITAVISEIVGSRFIITKIPQQRNI